MQNCDFESTLKSRLWSRNRPIIGGYRLVGEIDLLSLIDIGSTLTLFACADVELLNERTHEKNYGKLDRKCLNSEII